MKEYELYHHGVKGQKWGVRKDKERAREFRSDKKALSSMKKDAQFSRDAIRLYNRKIKTREQLQRHTKKDGRMSKELDKQLQGLQKGHDYYSALSKKQCAELTKQANRLQQKYKDKKIKDINTKTLKSGETAIKKDLKGIMTQDYDYLSMSKHITFNKNGDVQYNYTPVKNKVRVYNVYY